MRYPIADSADCCHGVPLRALFNLCKLLLTVHCWWIYTVVGVTDCSRTQLSDSRSPHCCRNLKQISCTRGVAFFCPAKLDNHCNYSFKFRTLVGLWVLRLGVYTYFEKVYEAERIPRRGVGSLNLNNNYALIQEMYRLLPTGAQ